LRNKHAEEIADLTKKHEEELATAKRDKESAIKTMNVVQGSLNAKDEKIKALTKDNEVALAELASLRQEKENWGLRRTIWRLLLGSSMKKASSLRWNR
jgi:hypothetical protein